MPGDPRSAPLVGGYAPYGVTMEPDHEAAGIAWRTGVWNRISDIYLGWAVALLPVPVKNSIYLSCLNLPRHFRR